MAGVRFRIVEFNHKRIRLGVRILIAGFLSYLPFAFLVYMHDEGNIELPQGTGSTIFIIFFFLCVALMIIGAAIIVLYRQKFKQTGLLILREDETVITQNSQERTLNNLDYSISFTRGKKLKEGQKKPMFSFNSGYNTITFSRPNEVLEYEVIAESQMQMQVLNDIFSEIREAKANNSNSY